MPEDSLNHLTFDELMELMANTVNEIMNLPKTEQRKAQIKEKNKLLRLLVAKTKQVQSNLK